MRQINNMRVMSDDPELKHTFQFESRPVGEVDVIDGKKYRVIDNSKNTIVTYEPVEMKQYEISITISDGTSVDAESETEAIAIAEDLFKEWGYDLSGNHTLDVINIRDMEE